MVETTAAETATLSRLSAWRCRRDRLLSISAALVRQ